MMLHGGNMAGKCTNKPITAHRRRSGPGPLAAVGLDPSREPHQLQVPQRLQHCIMHLAYRAAAMQLGITPQQVQQLTVRVQRCRSHRSNDLREGGARVGW